MSWRAPWLRERISLLSWLYGIFGVASFIPLITGGELAPGLVYSSIGTLIIVWIGGSCLLGRYTNVSGLGDGVKPFGWLLLFLFVCSQAWLVGIGDTELAFVVSGSHGCGHRSWFQLGSIFSQADRHGESCFDMSVKSNRLAKN